MPTSTILLPYVANLILLRHHLFLSIGGILLRFFLSPPNIINLFDTSTLTILTSRCLTINFQGWIVYNDYSGSAKQFKICLNVESILYTIICIHFVWILYTNCIQFLWCTLFADQNWYYTKCMQTVYKMYPTFQQTLYTFYIQNLAAIVLLILYTKTYAKVCWNVGYILYKFCTHQLYTSFTNFVYKMNTWFLCWLLGSRTMALSPAILDIFLSFDLVFVLIQ